MAITSININKIGNQQAISIPQEMSINDDKVYLKKVGNSIHIIPYHNVWQNMIDSVDLFTNDFMNESIKLKTG